MVNQPLSIRRLSPEAVRLFRRRLLDWYARHGRHDFIWRKRPTPYRVLVAEVMLQQTQVSRVEPKYREFLRRYPTMRSLAAAKAGELLKLWSGLGYNRRALMLQACARQVISRHRSRLPGDLQELQQLPGVGPYTAAAINVFARNRDEVCIDTNVRRVLIHELKLPRRIRRRALEAVARAVLPRGRAREWHSALMDYGRLVATAHATGVRPTARPAGRFAGSARYFRGQVLKALLAGNPMMRGEIRQRLGLSRRRLAALLRSLESDGLVVVRGESVRLPA